MLTPLGAQTVELDHDGNGSAIQEYLATRLGVGRVTVPQVSLPILAGRRCRASHGQPARPPQLRIAILIHVSFQIYINQKLVGGCSELQALHSAGKLEALLKGV